MTSDNYNPIADAICWGPQRIEDYVCSKIREHAERRAVEAMRRREIEAMKIMAYLTLPMVMEYDASGNLLPARY